MRIARLCVVMTASLLALTAACASPIEPSELLDRQVVLGRGDATRILGAGFSLRFDGVTGDSRCPGDALCIQGGDAIVQVTVIPGSGQTSRYELHTASPASASHGDVVLTLEELSPYPFASMPFDPADYRATIRVTR